MKVIILAGGRGTRLAEETIVRPKPMVEIGGRPILWHIMNIYASHGFKDFIVACGYKGEMIKQYFSNYLIHHSDYIVDLKNGTKQIINKDEIDWNVALMDTGLDTNTGGRLLRLKHLIGDETFMVTYGDGVGNVNLTKLVAFHQQHGKLATVTAVHPPARYGDLVLQENTVTHFAEKPQTGAGWINGGFFVFEPGVFSYIAGDNTSLEMQSLEKLVQNHQLAAYRHKGFWQPMDTIREKELLDRLWSDGTAPWKTG